MSILEENIKDSKYGRVVIPKFFLTGYYKQGAPKVGTPCFLVRV